MSAVTTLLLVVLVACAVGAAFLVTGIAATRPRHAWLLLTAVCIVTSGMMPFGYTIIDELLTACLLFGVLVSGARLTAFGASRDDDLVARLHRAAFLLFTAYMIAQGLRGLVELDSLRKARWIVFYGMLGLLAIMHGAGRLGAPQGRKVVSVVAGATLAYLTLYLLHGMSGELVRGVSKESLQRSEWATTAYALLPVPLALPAVLLCVRDPDQRMNRLGWMTLVAMAAAALYYDSRASILALLAFLLVAAPRLGLRRLAKSAVALGVILYVFLGVVWPASRDLSSVTQDVLGSGSALWQTEEGQGRGRDVDRWIHLQVAFRGSTDPRFLLFGHGLQTHGFVISSRVRALYEEYGLARFAAAVRDDESTEGLTALVVDTGVVGLLLLLLNFMLVAWQVLRQRGNPSRGVILLSAALLFIWPILINMLDVLLFYLAIMPGGLLLLMARASREQTVAPLPAARSRMDASRIPLRPPHPA